MIRLRPINVRRLTRNVRDQLMVLTKRGHSNLQDVLNGVGTYADGKLIVVAAYCTLTRRYVGWAAYHKRDDINIYVKRSYRRMGIGKRLILNILTRRAKLERDNCTVMVYDTFSGQKFWNGIKTLLTSKYDTTYGPTYGIQIQLPNHQRSSITRIHLL